MRRSLTRATAASTAAALALSLLAVPPALADEDDEPAPSGAETAAEQDALTLARETGEPVEITALTDEKTVHYANPDGTLTAEISALPVRVRTGQGWIDADTTLVAGTDGLVRPRAAGMDIAFSGGGEAPMARIGIGSNSVELDWDGPLPTPVLDGDQATYPDVLPDVDLVLTAGVEGFTQVLVVHTPEAAASPELAELELPLEATGVTLEADEHGNIEAIGDEGGQGVFNVQAPAMWDSTGIEDTLGEDPAIAPTTGARTALVETDLTVDSIRLVPDQGLLTGEDTEYPVYIDPSVSANRPNTAYVDKTFPNQSYFNKKESVGVGYYSGGEGTFTRRAFMQFTVMGRTAHPNTIINSATLRTEVAWAYNCNSNSNVQLHRTDAFTSKTTWNNQPTARTLLDTQNVKGGWATCPATSGVEFNATTAYKWGVDNSASHIYLRLKEQNESATSAWRRFDFKNKPPVLVVNYNHPPEKPVTSTLSDSLGGACATDKTKPRLVNNTEVTLRGQLRDRDSYYVGQQVKGQFEWKVDGASGNLGSSDSAYVTVAKWSGGSYRTVVARNLPQNQLIAYRLRGHDQQNWGPWSAWCYLKVDTTKPETGPKVTSTDYPAGDTLHGTVGRSGDFTFSNNGVAQAVAYHYSLNDASCSTKITLGTPGATVTVPITPRRDGPNLLHARTTDAFGNSSECVLVYTFTVAPPSDPVSYFPLDEGQGGTATDVMDPNRVATANATVGWTRGRVGETDGSTYRLEGTALHTTNGNRLTTENPVIDTDDAFTVSAWVRLDEATANHTAVSQDGDRHSGFYLGYNNTSDGNWVFKQAPYDGDGTNIAHRVYSKEPARLGMWTHLLGTFDPETGELALYVDGELQGEVTQQTPWNATGPLVIGGARYKGAFFDAWPGAIDDVRVWDRVLTDEVPEESPDSYSEIWELANRPAALEGHWQLNETEGTAVADSSDHGLTGTLHGDPLTAWNTAMNDVTFAPGVSLDPATRERVTTTGPAVRTDRSYSVAAWVRLDEVGHNATAVSQDGGAHSGFYLAYQYTYEWNNWVMKVPPRDAIGATGWHRALSDDAPEFGRWTHLAATYDHTRREVTLYVDGVKNGTAAVPAAWHAGGPVVIGGARFEQRLAEAWAGDISDVHLYQGVLTEDDLDRVRWGALPVQ
ncbi:LamG-like jellyroll fold domain-containing protein [Nocardiopsis protaetiae]|uniref:LamG-like jellyroll fold domain-containing protein n=1 Tax=Nocardiopsis protaetiae TaxID=3382270 RepID=UPI00387B98DC